MLRQMRTFSRSWVANALLLLLVGAFAIWGINDVFSGVGAQDVAKVGGRAISPAQLSREMELTLRAQRRQGRNMSQEEAVAAGMHTRLLESMITRAAMGHYSDQLGVSASDAQVAERIRQIPAVMNPLTNTFDESAYAQFLNEYRYARPEFENEMRSDISTEMLRHALTVGVRAPASFGALVLAYESETRVISVAEAPSSLAGNIPAPTGAQIQTFYEDNQASLQVPEYRALTLVYARVQDFAARIDVPEQRLREEFEARRASLTQPERRTYVRIAAQTEAQAQDAAARLGRGEAPNAVAQALGLQLTRAENQTREQVTDSAVAAAVFSLARGQARAVQASLSPWAVVRVEAVTLAAAPDFAAARAGLRSEIANEEAAELLNAAVSGFEDARAGGASTGDAGRGAGLHVVTIAATDAQGRGDNGQPLTELAEQTELLASAFATPEGEASDFTPIGDADVVVSVDRIIPASTRPLEQVRPQMVAGWTARERSRRLQQIADDVAEAVSGGQSFAAAARGQRVAVLVASRPIDRQAASQLPARRLGALIFSAAPGQVVNDIRVDGGAIILAYVERIDRVDPATAPQMLEAARAQIQEVLAASVDEAAAAEVVTRARPTRNEALIGRMFNTGAGAEQENQQ